MLTKRKMEMDLGNRLEFDSKEFFEEVDSLISYLGKEVKDEDRVFLNFCISGEVEKALNKTNRESIPLGLREYLKRAIVFKFYETKEKMEALKDFDYEEANSKIRTITEGDVSYSFGEDLDPKERFMNSLEALLSEGESDYLCYRKLKW